MKSIFFFTWSGAMSYRDRYADLLEWTPIVRKCRWIGYRVYTRAEDPYTS